MANTTPPNVVTHEMALIGPMLATIAAIQSDLEWEDHETNRRRLADRMWAAAAAGAHLIVLPEMFPTGFSMNAEEIAEDHDGESVQWLVDQASTHGLHVCGSISMRSPGCKMPQSQLSFSKPARIWALLTQT